MSPLDIQTDPKLIALNAAIVKAHEQEILCDDRDHREHYVAAYALKAIGFIVNPELGEGMRKVLRDELAWLQKDDGVECMAKRKINLVKHQADLEEQKVQRIIELERIEAEKIEAMSIVVGEF